MEKQLKLINQIRKELDELELLYRLEDSIDESLTEYTKVELWVDGGSKGNPGWGYCSYAFGDIQETHRLGDGFTSNEAEYWAVLRGMQGVINSHDPKTIGLTIKTDSALVVGQLTEGWKIKAENLRPLIENAKHQLSQFASWRIEKAPRHDIEMVLGH